MPFTSNGEHEETAILRQPMLIANFYLLIINMLIIILYSL